MPAPKGHRIPNAPKGRKGPNKLTRSVKEAFEHVFKDLQKDPAKPYALAKWGQEQPTEFYKLAAKLIPAEIKGDLNHTHKLTPEVDIVAAALGVSKKPE